jgi:phage gpG-like protein
MATGGEAFRRALRDMAQKLPHLSAQLAPVAVTCVQLNMDGPFTPNAPLTKSLKNGGAKPLFDTGETRASITYVADRDGFAVGSPLPHTPLINNGGTVSAKTAKSLVIPATRAIKRRTEAQGIRGVLAQLEAAGWKIVWRPKAVLGAAPDGATPQGIPLQAKASKTTSGSKKKQRRLFLLFYRKKSITVPAREFMVLHDDQQALLLQEAQRYLRKAK